jgi:hypothetical protein
MMKGGGFKGYAFSPLPPLPLVSSHNRDSQRIMGHKDRSVTGLTWCGDRLFSAGTHGQVTEWDLDTLSPRLVRDLLGHPLAFFFRWIRTIIAVP